ncbi:MAG: bifunctional proline dehydrogenase/L-glutamate gamma-semialdehyde dehydrogenase PutA [Methylocystis sp.]|nr:bifunctional proline dehydrogenase/L-glutamate gamma-semialdehyde dehydrogenase PutA [Methylocystis sp.]MCA3582569.1 bifunctional proline dehydrogenase/L-glutamate gamma-semialdehyde dehydrogenase PutA [Methylocystis sp.]MCA3586836.1 bifunctional proline dehydrogenase/L-glutamate gamma-semialdehyde dehydrogenase PutA [Methylocystis sp.]MCA3591758.1 bifunctional proline dehydrogenase/L-glutamate gamma-semialdehyde dehydrogenase PutA [Methylocystis sp.]
MPALSPFRAPYAPDDAALAAALLATAALPPEREARIDRQASALIGAIRKGSGGIGGIEEVLREYSLSTKEGLALMVLAEALLRVPDSATADKLIEDKLGQGDFANHESRSDALLVNASAWALGITARIIQPGEEPVGILQGLAKRIGLPTVRVATRQAMRVMGNHFVLGETIADALKRAGTGDARLFRYSFDMLGEGARTAADARRYFQSYAEAIAAIGKAAGNQPLPDRPGISVKLSALHPRYEALSRERVMAELVPLVVDLAGQAKAFDLNFTIDAEEADRLELSLDVIAAVAGDPSLAGWDGFGLAIQAYQKRAIAVIDWIEALASALDRRFMVRLVKGAYWDTEVKRAQERGLAGYPVWTRKAMTDLNYVACAERLLAARPRLYPQFATHNALTVAAILERAGKPEGFEFQRLHGMGEALYDDLLKENAGIACRTYAPVGGHKDLLAYLVRRLLENGANTSFVSASADPDVPVADLLKRPQAVIGRAEAARHPKLPLPADIYAPERQNSMGVELGHEPSLKGLLKEMAVSVPSPRSVRGEGQDEGRGREGVEASKPSLPPPGSLRSPPSPQGGGKGAEPDKLFASAIAAFPAWNATPVTARAACLDRMADRLEAERGRFLSLLQSEAFKTLDDAVAELREAVDFCRYYAAEARKHFAPEGVLLPGPTGEENRLRLKGRGVFVCISPWNFPLAIFLGQVAAALAAGNAVIAKPAEQTPLIAMEAVKLLHAVGVPEDVVQIAVGDGRMGAALVAHPRAAGVCFTGSTEVARLINRSLAAKDGPIVPLIAETGGINAMIVDGTALPEQVTDDVVMSAFRSAGQRCSALRLLCVEEHVADKIIEMIVGAAQELKVGDPADLSVQVGPVIDAEAKARLDAHIAVMKKEAKLHFAGKAPAEGTYVAPHVFEISWVSDLKEEIFGPILHVVRWRAGDRKRGLHAVLDAIAATGFGLTGGLHTRIDETIREVEARSPAGNLYVNRNMIGAVVGTQPFGGSGLSGTGPKAGGPHYLMRFASEQVVSINTAAAGGNASLVAMGEE